MDISDWSVLKDRLELEERGFDVAICKAFNDKMFYIYLNVILYHLILIFIQIKKLIDGSVVTHITGPSVPAASTQTEANM